MNTVQQFRKRQVVIEAIQLLDNELSIQECQRFIQNGKLDNNSCQQAEDHWDDYLRIVKREGGISIPTLEGRMLASFGDYIIKGVKGEFYPCKPDIFDATYDAEVMIASIPPELSTQNLSFSEALQFLKSGKKVCREGWNGKGMWVKGVQGFPINEFMQAANPDNISGQMCPYFVIQGAGDSKYWGEGKKDYNTWVPSVSDIYAEDWMLVP